MTARLVEIGLVMGVIVIPVIVGVLAHRKLVK